MSGSLILVSFVGGIVGICINCVLFQLRPLVDMPQRSETPIWFVIVLGYVLVRNQLRVVFLDTIDSKVFGTILLNVIFWSLLFGAISNTMVIHLYGFRFQWGDICVIVSLILLLIPWVIMVVADKNSRFPRALTLFFDLMALFLFINFAQLKSDILNGSKLESESYDTAIVAGIVLGLVSLLEISNIFWPACRKKYLQISKAN